MRFSRERPDLADARFTMRGPQVTEDGWDAMRAALNASHTEAPFIDMHEQATSSRYLASLDGNGWAARLPFLLCSGSLVLKQDSDLGEFWYPLLKPYVSPSYFIFQKATYCCIICSSPKIVLGTECAASCWTIPSFPLNNSIAFVIPLHS